MKPVTLVAHADWSKHPAKRWAACAMRLADGGWRLAAPWQVADGREYLHTLRGLCHCEEGTDGLHPLSPTEQSPPWLQNDGSILAGFDFPIGLPVGYAKTAGIHDFTAFLPRIGQDGWSRFYDVAQDQSEISLQRPFYPHAPGTARLAHLAGALGLQREALLRQCERATATRPAAAPLFWTMGAKQVGKAAISGWREVISPALGDPAAALWPFAGRLADLLETHAIVLAETYPAEFYRHLGYEWFAPHTSKRDPVARKINTRLLLAVSGERGYTLEPGLRQQLLTGFGDHPGGEDAFDAITGLFGMLRLLEDVESVPEPPDGDLRRIEGWILGQRISIN